MVLRALFQQLPGLGSALPQQLLVGVTGCFLIVDALSVSVGLSPLRLPCWSPAAAFLKAPVTPHRLRGWAAQGPCPLALSGFPSTLLTRCLSLPVGRGSFQRGKEKLQLPAAPEVV